MTLCNCFNRGLLDAIDNKDKEAVKVMLSCGADPNYREGSALMRAADSGVLEIVRLLLAHGAGISDTYSSAALGVAESRGHFEIATLLRSRAEKIKRATGRRSGPNL